MSNGVSTPRRQMTEEQEKWYERETAAFRAWWEAYGEKTYSETPTMAAGAGWLKRAESELKDAAPQEPNKQQVGADSSSLARSNAEPAAAAPSEKRPCTCAPEDVPGPCQHKYAASECIAAARSAIEGSVGPFKECVYKTNGAPGQSGEASFARSGSVSAALDKGAPEASNALGSPPLDKSHRHTVKQLESWQQSFENLRREFHRHGNHDGQRGCEFALEAIRQYQMAEPPTEPQVVGRVWNDEGQGTAQLNSVGRALPDDTPLYSSPVSAIGAPLHLLAVMRRARRYIDGDSLVATPPREEMLRQIDHQLSLYEPSASTDGSAAK